MTKKLGKATTRWLRAERRNRDADAERALRGVFRSLPVPVPSRALLERTLAELGMSPVAARPHWVFRWAVSLALVLAGLATAIYGPVLFRAFSVGGTIDWFVDLGAGLLTSLSRLLAAAVALWDVIVRIGEAAGDVVATPQVLGVMLLTVLFGLATLRLLTGIVVVERSRYHA